MCVMQVLIQRKQSSSNPTAEYTMFFLRSQ
nr:MAG TPA: hypothetical protein [Caudoviricetes sp.]DAG32370.1 MAG TPA: hypothetical protein [Caudoviricetes sp.]